MIEVDKVILDTGGFLAFYLAEPGGPKMEHYLSRIQSGSIKGYINIVNLAELNYVLARKDLGVAEEKIDNLRLFGVEVVPVDNGPLWKKAAGIKAKGGLSFANAFAVATAIEKGGSLIVGDDSNFEGKGVPLIRIQKKSE